MHIFLDLDDTLVDSESAHRTALEKIWSEHQQVTAEIQSLIEKKWFEISEKYLSLYFEGKITLEQQRIQRIRTLWEFMGINIDENQAWNLYDHYHQYFLHSCFSFPDTYPCLQKIRDFRLGIITNGITGDQMFKLKFNHLFQYFDTVIISEETGVVKPDADIFIQAAIASGTAINSCVYVGNSFETDYLGSMNAGMKAIWLDHKNKNDHPGSERITSLSDLAAHPFLQK